MKINATAFALTFCFAQHTGKRSKAKRECKPPHGDTAKLTATALNVNRFGQSVCELQTVVLRGEIRAAANIRLKEILKKGALTVKRTVVHLINSCGYTNSRASNPPFLKLL